MATAYTYAPDGGGVNPRGDALIDPDYPQLSLREVVFRIPISSGASGDTHTITVPWACRVIDAWTVPDGTTYDTSADTVTISDGTGDITNAISFVESTSTAGLVQRATTIVPTYAVIAKGGTIIATLGTISATTPGGELFIRVVVLPTSEQ